MDFFVGGCAKSGTTLLNAILCSDSQTGPRLPECNFLLSAVEAIGLAQNGMKTQGNHHFRDEKALFAFGRTWIEAWVAQTRQLYPEHPHLVMKFPRLTTVFNYLCLLLPEARFLVIVRDPRDLAAAYFKVHDKMMETNQGGSTLPRNPVTVGNFIWSHYLPVITACKQGQSHRFHVIRYEDLVNRPTEIVNGIRRFTGLALTDCDPGAKWLEKRPDGLVDDPTNLWHSELWGQPVTPNRIGTYTDVLTEPETQELEKTCATMMQIFGYKPHAATS